jgi:hypothetical protein
LERAKARRATKTARNMKSRAEIAVLRAAGWP